MKDVDNSPFHWSTLVKFPNSGLKTCFSVYRIAIFKMTFSLRSFLSYDINPFFKFILKHIQSHSHAEMYNLVFVDFLIFDLEVDINRFSQSP